jgi:hypothetical protein
MCSNTFICMCLKFTPSSSTTRCQLVKCGRGVKVAYVVVALLRICSKSAMVISRRSFSHTLLCQMPQAILSVVLTRPCPSAHSLPAPRSLRRTVRDTADSVGRHSSLEKASSARTLAGSRMKTSRTGGFARFLHRIEGSVRSCIAPSSTIVVLQTWITRRDIRAYSELVVEVMWKPRDLAEVDLGREVTWSEGRRHRKLLSGKDRLIAMELGRVKESNALAEVRGECELFVCDVAAQNGSHMSSCAPALSVH